ncbi:hypothetical protein DUI87_00426 [Hirundo rustica rustica]|uniref:SERRATE/Ars2 N-terminal domain-containing protein n=1 Tax=Hirundo rustica rustica TaxID=333673 RepID=A0A3M0LHV2_HIRRU|nr:hypothetical protein DUI87_00426 [Hirundo rustica rustica]
MQHQLLQHQLLPIQARLGTIAEVDLGMAPPVMKSFKEFLLSLDDAVDETEAVKRYNDYKLDFRRQQLQEFFLAHKDEEWFRSKYHPDEAGKRQQEAQAALRNRLGVFLYLWEHGWFDNLLLDIDRAPQIIKTLDAAVIKMEGGTEHDLRILEQEEEEERTEKAEGPKKEEPRPPEPPGKGTTERPEGDDSAKAEGAEPGAEPASGAGPEEEAGPDKGPKAEEGDKEGGAKARPRQRSRDSEDGDSDSGDSEGGTRRAASKDAAGVRAEPRVNRDLTRRVRNVSGLTQHRPIVRHDIKLAARLVAGPGRARAPLEPAGGRGDGRGDSGAGRARRRREPPATAEPPPATEPGAQNPVLRHITDYLIEEVSAEEEELLGTGQGQGQGQGQGAAPAEDAARETNPAEVTVERDEKLLKVLDRLLLYLRIVHSVDYYNTSEYPNEDEMPNRCGIIHVRGPAAAQPRVPRRGVPNVPSVPNVPIAPNVPLPQLSPMSPVLSPVSEWQRTFERGWPRCWPGPALSPVSPVSPMSPLSPVSEWQRTFEARLAPLLAGPGAVPEEEAQRLGRKDPEQELEKFVSANTQELGKDKWLCPLSGKKFKGPEFVRKHIFNKHGDKMGAVRKEVFVLQQFLMDPKRPALPEGARGARPRGPTRDLTRTPVGDFWVDFG